jgi:hypothetical protein
MSYGNRIVAFIFGIVLYPGTVYVTEFVAPGMNHYYGFAVPGTDYFYSLALPCFVLSLALSWMTFRWLARPPRVAIWWCIGGLIVGLLCLELATAVRGYDAYRDQLALYHSGLFHMYEHRNGQYYEVQPTYSIATTILNGLLGSIPNLLSILAGLAAAAAMALRSERITARASYA